MRLHTGSKPFKCPICELRFRTSGHRKTHIQSHYKSNLEAKRGKKPGERQTRPEALPSVGMLQSGPADATEVDPVYISGNPVMSSPFEQNLLQPGVVGQAILPASLSSESPWKTPVSSIQRVLHTALGPQSCVLETKNC